MDENKLKARYDKQNERIKETYDRVSVVMPKGTKDRIQKAGETLNSYIVSAIIEKLEKDGF